MPVNILPLFEIALVLLRLDYVATVICRRSHEASACSDYVLTIWLIRMT
jgi:hypothetical protein